MTPGSLAPDSAGSASPPVEQPVAGSLPPELLTIIFKHGQALFEKPEGKQQERLRQACVCRSWYSARIKRNHYHVDGDAQADALIATFEANPARASRVNTIHIEYASSHWARVLELCTNVVDVSLFNENRTPFDALRAIPASVRALKLNLNGYDSSMWMTDLAAIPSRVALDVQFWWDSSAGGRDTNEVAEAIAPLLQQITRLALFDVAPEKDRPENRGFLEPLLPGMTSLKQLEVTLWQVHTAQLASVVAQLDTLEQLKLVDFEGYWTDELTIEIVTDIIEDAPPTVKEMSIALSMVEDRWSTAERKNLKKTANNRGIELLFVDYDGFDEDEEQVEQDLQGQARLEAMGLSFEEEYMLWRD